MKTKTSLKLLSSFKLKGRESELRTRNYWSEALLTLRLQPARTGRFPWLACRPSAWQWRQPHRHRTGGCFGAFSRGRSADRSTARSLHNTSGISTEIYCCLPKPYLLLTCHNVASAFFRLLEGAKPSPTGERLYGTLWREKLSRLSTRMERRAEPGAAPPRPRAATARARHGSFHPRGTTQTQHLQRLLWQGLLTKWKTTGFLVK